MSITFDFMILILPKIKFEAIPSKDAVAVAFWPDTDRSHEISSFCHNSFSLVDHMALILEYLDSSERAIPKMYLCAPSPRSDLRFSS